ncbi:MAG: DNA polymerase IV [Dehalococcoidales bacterium]|jgi:DNA polymerase-4
MAICRIIHVDLDAFFVSVEQVDHPELRGKPVVVGGRPDTRGVVAAASYEARAFGVHSAMPLRTAARLCPQCIFVEGNFARYAEASRKFMAMLADFTPFLEPMGLDEAYMDVTGFESLHGSMRAMALTIKKRVKDDLGINVSVGIANSRVVAKIASDASKPDGLIEVPPGGETAFLAPLPIRRMPGIGEKTEPVLKRLGIDTIGKLARVPAEELKKLLGGHGEHLRNMALGLDDSPVLPPGEAKSMSRETTFAEDLRDRTVLEATLRYLAERVGRKLRQSGKLARCVTIKLRYADFATITRNHTLPQATVADGVIFEAGLKLLHTAMLKEKRAVRLIGIGVTGFTEAGQQLSLLDNSTLRLAKLDKAVDRIREKYGFGAIQTGRTMKLRELFEENERGYSLHTPGLSR